MTLFCIARLNCRKVSKMVWACQEPQKQQLLHDCRKGVNSDDIRTFHITLLFTHAPSTFGKTLPLTHHIDLRTYDLEMLVGCWCFSSTSSSS